ncbi:hypothetical protein FACS189437_10750 [Bacteroidia bacterium]|nr:hypothetical protein FACS189437_10750 [Bacteroidia bacterium]
MADFYDLDVAQGIIARTRILEQKKYIEEKNPEKKLEIKKTIDLLREEEKALGFNNPMQLSVIDKAFNFYAPKLKKKNGCPDEKKIISRSRNTSTKKRRKFTVMLENTPTENISGREKLREKLAAKEIKKSLATRIHFRFSKKSKYATLRSRASF